MKCKLAHIKHCYSFLPFLIKVITASMPFNGTPLRGTYMMYSKSCESNSDK